MVTNKPVRMLIDELAFEKTLATAAVMVGMSERMAQRYKKLSQLPSDVAVEHTWQTREDPFLSSSVVGRGSTSGARKTDRSSSQAIRAMDSGTGSSHIQCSQ